MQVSFVEKPNGPSRLVCEAEVTFEAEGGPLVGMKLVGFSVWRSVEGELYVTLPCRPFGAGSERKYWDLLRVAEGGDGDPKRVKSWILEQYRASREAAA